MKKIEKIKQTVERTLRWLLDHVPRVPVPIPVPVQVDSERRKLQRRR